WRRIVLFPIPRSPPTSTSEPGTTPPPRTKSNSASPVRHRVSSPPTTSPNRAGDERLAPARATAPPAPPRDAPPRPPPRGRGSSTRVFQALQAEHCPDHRGDSLPHSVQKKTV